MIILVGTPRWNNASEEELVGVETLPVGEGRCAKIDVVRGPVDLDTDGKLADNVIDSAGSPRTEETPFPPPSTVVGSGCAVVAAGRVRQRLGSGTSKIVVTIAGLAPNVAKLIPPTA